jgi:hypothetical protein
VKPRTALPPRRRKPRARLHVVTAPPDWSALTEAILARSDGLCEACGLPLPGEWGAWDRHHRKLQSQGGQDVLTNLVGVHSDCHVNQPWSIHMRPTWATAQGLIVPSWVQDPARAPLTLPDGRLVLLTDEGPYQLMKEGAKP